ncbi:DUF222 domain-containing protein [Citricoccus sp. GCM10030269]|uniref:HNH endonuclease signature motif containing protein n=1 Tax=Citricoccus sp. GCM10030269 TaxID=3273388 RepID=UPI003613D791
MALVDTNDLSAVDTADLLTSTQDMAAELASRLNESGLLDGIPRFPVSPDHDPRGTDHRDPDCEPSELDGVPRESSAEEALPAGTLPELQLGVEQLARTVDAAQTSLAGHTERVFDRHRARLEILGIPEGKCAFRNAADYLRVQLRIHRGDAKRRIQRAAHIMPSRSFDHAEELPPTMPAVAEAVGSATIDASAADIMVNALSSARHDAALAGADMTDVDELVGSGERLLVAQAQDVDPETLKKVCLYWRQRFDALVDPDGAEPTEAQLNAAQGLYYHGKGAARLHKWTLMATDAQHEILKTIASAASNPRKRDGEVRGQLDSQAGSKAGSKTGGQKHDQAGSQAARQAGDPAPSADGSGPEGRARFGEGRAQLNEGQGAPDAFGGHADALDGRSRTQKELDGLISALTGALAMASSNELPTGGTRPQVLVTIDYETLRRQVDEGLRESRPASPISTASYTSPINPQTIRQWACDANLIPIVLGGEGQILDVGRSQRLFSQKLRQAIAARDGGCAAPGCSIPAPWCEVHHIQHWENGGPTSVQNGVLICSHHHHAVHTGAWEISVRNGIPWFIPARYHDPDQRPRRNRYWRPGNLREAA